MLHQVVTIAGLGWDPEIRGALAVLTGVAVLVGSVWLLLTTNSGARLATLLTLAGLFGWMAIMGSIWWVYGVGWVGEAPSWNTIEINQTVGGGPIALADLDTAAQVPTDPGYSAQELAEALGSELALADFGEVTADDLAPETIEGLSDDDIAAVVASENQRRSLAQITDLAAVDPEVVDQAIDEGFLDFGDWELLATSESGDAQAQASADLLEEGEFAGTGDFIFLNAYEIGGKPTLPDDPNRWDRIYRWFANAARITNPPRYVVVQAQAVIEQATIPGQAPPRAIADPDAPVVSVIMERDIGNLRLPPFMVMVGSTLIFLVLCYMLHVRDLELMRRRAEQGE